jgi:hypothetical protein
MPSDVRIQEIADCVEVAVQDSLEAPASELNVAHGHPAICGTGIDCEPVKIVAARCPLSVGSRTP